MNNLHNYRVRFLDADGAPIADRFIPAESLTVAFNHAEDIASEIEAADFYLTLMRTDRF